MLKIPVLRKVLKTSKFNSVLCKSFNGKKLKNTKVNKNERWKNFLNNSLFLHLKNKSLYIFLAFVIIIGIVPAGCSENKKPDIISDIEGTKGYVRTVSDEEKEFYSGLLEKSLEEGEDLEKAVEEKINEDNALYLISNKMGLTQPYSFQLLKDNMEKENRTRKAKLQQGIVFYGKEEFTLEEYYDWNLSNIKTDVVEYLYSECDDYYREDCEKYYNENSEEYRELSEIVFKIDENGSVSEKTLTGEDLSSLAKSDSDLYTALYNGEEGSEIVVENSNESRKVTILSKEYGTSTFDEAYVMVMRDYLSNCVLEDLIEITAEENPVEF